MRRFLFAMAAVRTILGADARPKALVYRGPTVCDGCPEAVAQLLETSPSNFIVDYVGPKEKIKLSADSLSKVDMYAHPGGPDLDKAYDAIKGSRKAIRDFVSNGGHYLGFCLGAYLAGYTPGLGLLPSGCDVDSESSQPKAQVTSDDDTVIQVDWTFGSGSDVGHSKQKVWMYFQDGVVLDIPEGTSGVKVLGRYSSNGDIAASVNGFGKGWVGLVGPHPEADQTWYDAEDIENPDGINFEYGWDLIEATYKNRS